MSKPSEAAMQDAHSLHMIHGDQVPVRSMAAALDAFASARVAEEREACAKVVDEILLPGATQRHVAALWRERIAAAIRARGEA